MHTQASVRIGAFTYYYYPVVNGVVLTIKDWLDHARHDHVPMTVFTPQVAREGLGDADVIEYPAIPLYKRVGITIPMSPQQMILSEIEKRGITILHTHHPFFIGDLALQIKKKTGIPLVFTYHTRYSDYAGLYLPSFSRKLIEGVITWNVVRFMNQCDAVTVANESLKHELLRKGVRVPLYIVPPGIETERFAAGDPLYIRKKYGISPKDPVLLYVGRLAKEKNIYFLLKSFVRIYRQVPSAKLLLAGGGLEEGNITRYLQRKKLRQAVIIASDFRPDTIMHAYAGADMFVYASKTETFGRVVVEAMAAGLPIVALNALSISDLITDEVTGRKIFRPSTGTFASTVVSLLRRKEIAKRLGREAKRQAQLLYDNTVSWRKLLEVYSLVLAGDV